MNRTCCIFVPVYGTGFLVRVFGADLWYVCPRHRPWRPGRDRWECLRGIWDVSLRLSWIKGLWTIVYLFTVGLHGQVGGEGDGSKKEVGETDDRATDKKQTAVAEFRPESTRHLTCYVVMRPSPIGCIMQTCLSVCLSRAHLNSINRKPYNVQTDRLEGAVTRVRSNWQSSFEGSTAAYRVGVSGTYLLYVSVIWVIDTVSPRHRQCVGPRPFDTYHTGLEADTAT